LEVLDAIKHSGNDNKEKFNIVDEFDDKNTKNDRLMTECNVTKSDFDQIEFKNDRVVTETNVKRGDSLNYREKITLDKINKSSLSPESRNVIPSKNITINSSVEKKVNKGINVIPIKPLNINKDNNLISNFSSNEKHRIAGFSQKPKDVKITASNISPRQKLSPVSQLPKRSEKVVFESKYSNKIYKDITSMHKSPSPKPDIKKK
jgi:hypothetical protein